MTEITHCFYPLPETFKNPFNSHKPPNGGDILFLPRCKETESQANRLRAAAKSLQSCPTLCDPIDGSPPGPAVPGIPQARTL